MGIYICSIVLTTSNCAGTWTGILVIYLLNTMLSLSIERRIAMEMTEVTMAAPFTWPVKISSLKTITL